MDTHDFIARFAGIYEHSPWVAERVAPMAEQLDTVEIRAISEDLRGGVALAQLPDGVSEDLALPTSGTEAQRALHDGGAARRHHAGAPHHDDELQAGREQGGVAGGGLRDRAGR